MRNHRIVTRVIFYYIVIQMYVLIIIILILNVLCVCCVFSSLIIGVTHQTQVVSCDQYKQDTGIYNCTIKLKLSFVISISKILEYTIVQAKLCLVVVVVCCDHYKLDSGIHNCNLIKKSKQVIGSLLYIKYLFVEEIGEQLLT